MKTVIRINSRSSGYNPGHTEEYEPVNPEICDVCGHEIFEDDGDYCPYCGTELEKEMIPAGSKRSSSGGGAILAVIAFVFIVIWLLNR